MSRTVNPQFPRTSLVALPYFYRGWLKGEILPVFPSHSHSEGHDLKKNKQKIQKSKAIASPTRALILRKPRAVKFSTCPLNAPVRGAGCRVGSTPEHFICLIFSTPSTVVSTPTKGWLATALHLLIVKTAVKLSPCNISTAFFLQQAIPIQFMSVIIADLQSLDFSSNRLFMKLFRTGSIDVVQECRSYFGIELPSCLLKKRQDKFLSRFNSVDNVFCRYCCKL